MRKMFLRDIGGLYQSIYSVKTWIRRVLSKCLQCKNLDMSAIIVVMSDTNLIAGFHASINSIILSLHSLFHAIISVQYAVYISFSLL